MAIVRVRRLIRPAGGGRSVGGGGGGGGATAWVARGRRVRVVRPPPCAGRPTRSPSLISTPFLGGCVSPFRRRPPRRPPVLSSPGSGPRGRAPAPRGPPRRAGRGSPAA